jgi:murein DD-endopeptidase MepM/ murein hydrolase activator NlpD
MIKNGKKIAKKASIFFRGIFEFKLIKEIFGLSVIGAAFINGIFPSSVSSFQTLLDINFAKISPQEIHLKTENSFQKPVEIFRITKGYSFFHPAIDLATDAGSAVLPILPGKVEKVSLQRFGYGNHVIINHGSGYQSLYAHLIKIAVKEGQQVQKDTVIGFIGSTGHSTGPHLHLEIAYNGQKINPRRLFEDYFDRKLASSR